MVQTAQGERAVLLPVPGPGEIKASPAYGDGRLTLYKLKDSPAWALARTDRPGEPPQHCIPQSRRP